MYLLFVISGNLENYTFLVKDIRTNCFFLHILASSNGVSHIVESKELDKIGTLTGDKPIPISLCRGYLELLRSMYVNTTHCVDELHLI